MGNIFFHYYADMYREYDRMSSSGKETLAQIDATVTAISDPDYRFFYLKKGE
mgnify:CR=1 FL=1